jgi:hypothetical protein
VAARRVEVHLAEPGADCRRRHEALVLAVEQATNSYYVAGEREAETAARAAKEQRERSAAELRRAHEMVVSGLDAYEDLAAAANATADPTMKRPRPALRSAEVGRPAIRGDRGLIWLDALAGWIEEQKLAAEEEPEPLIPMGWSGLGKPTQPPGSRLLRLSACSPDSRTARASKEQPGAYPLY